MKMKAVLGLALLLAATAAAAVAVRGGCGTGVNSAICVGEMRVPRNKAPLFETASTQAIDALASPEFKADLEQFIAGLSPSDEHAAEWKNRDSGAIVAGLLRGVHGVRIRTYGGPLAYIAAKGPAKDVANEGPPGGPIQLNRYALGTSADIAASIAHEAAHRPPLGLTHDSYGRDTRIGYCEPPYVIGQLVRKRIQGSTWRPGGTDCHKLHPSAR